MEGFYAPGHSAVLDEERSRDRASLTELENRAIREVVERQIECGLDVVSDGEFRRWMFLNSFYDAVEGFRTDNVVTFRNDQGRPVELAVHEIVDRLRPVDSPAAREAAFMSVDHPPPVQGHVPGCLDLRTSVHVQARAYRQGLR